MSTERFIISNVTKRYKAVTALDHVSMELDAGIYGLLGPNGAGKTTLMKCIADLIRPEEGDILYEGKSIYQMGEAFRGLLGFMPQDLGFYPSFTAEEILRYFALLKGCPITKEEIGRRLEDVNLAEVRKKRVGGFSGGMKRRLGIAVTMLGDPQVLIFDEPTAGLDPGERIRFKNLLLELGKSRIVLVSTHIISDLEELCGKIYFIQSGNIVKVADICRETEEASEKKSALEQEYMDVFMKSDEE